MEKPLVALVTLVAVSAAAAPGCIDPMPSCAWDGGTIQPYAGSGEVLVPVAGLNDPGLEANFSNASYALVVEILNTSARATFEFSFVPSPSHEDGLASPAFSSGAPGTTARHVAAGEPQRFRIHLEVNASDPFVRSWVFFGRDNAVGGAFTVAADSGLFSAESQDFKVGAGGGEFTVVGGLRFLLSPAGVCT